MLPEFFLEKLATAKARSGGSILVELSPTIQTLPMPMLRYDDAFLPYSKAVISASIDLVCGFLFEFPAYLALGAAGAVALERSIAFVKSHNHSLAILNGGFSNAAYAEGAAALAVDAVTVVSLTGSSAYERAGIAPLLFEDLAIFDLIGKEQIRAVRHEEFAQAIREIIMARRMS